MATQRQKRLAKAIVENIAVEKPKLISELVVLSGYSETTADKHIPAILELKGLQEELAKLGFDENNAKAVVGKILNTGKEENQLKAADMVFKVNSTYAPEKHVSLNVKGEVKDFVKHKEIVDEFEAKLLKEYQNE